MYSNAGGSVGTMYRGKSLGASPTWTGNLGNSQSVNIAINGNVILAGLGNEIQFLNGSGNANARLSTTTSGDGTLLLRDNAGTSFSRLQFGGTTASYPALRRNSNTLDVRLADDSNWGNLNVGNIIFLTAAVNVSAGQISIGATTATTVGAAGAAAAIPTPVGYIIINVAGTQMKIPYCNT